MCTKSILPHPILHLIHSVLPTLKIQPLTFLAAAQQAQELITDFSMKVQPFIHFPGFCSSIPRTHHWILLESCHA